MQLSNSSGHTRGRCRDGVSVGGDSFMDIDLDLDSDGGDITGGGFDAVAVDGEFIVVLRLLHFRFLERYSVCIFFVFFNRLATSDDDLTSS